MKIKFSKDFLLHPSAIFIGIIVGIVIGLTSTWLPPRLETLGKIYLSLLEMCILPIIITAVVSSLGHLLHSKTARGYIRRLLWVFVIGMVFAACIGILSGVVIKPGERITAAEKAVIGSSIEQMQNSLTLPKPVEAINTNFFQFLNDVIPTNIFSAIVQGKSLPVLFFFLLLGSALGLLRSDNAKATLTFIDTLYTALFRIVIWIMYGLPFGLCFLFASYVGQIGFPLLHVLIKWLLTMIGTLLLMSGIYTAIVWRYYRGDFLQAVEVMRYPWIVAFGTSSSLVTLPAMLRSLQSGLKVNKYISELVIPLGVHFNLQGSVIAFSLLGLFISQLFGQATTLHQIAVVAFASIFAAIAVPAVPTIMSVGFVALVLQPLDLPVMTGMIIFFAAVPILDPFITLTNVYGNIVSTILIAHPKKNQIQQLEK
jgi:Na+/H+-dicarboxylate symporter